MRPGERGAGKRSSSRKTKPRSRRDYLDIPDRQVERLVRAFRAIGSATLRMQIVGFAEAIAFPAKFRRRR